MKKLTLVLLACLFIASQAFAGTDNKTILAETNLIIMAGYGTAATSDTVYLQDYKDKSIFVKYDETDTGSVKSAVVTYEVSYDNSNWLSGNFYDYDGTSTLQTSETLSTDGWYYLIPNPDLLTPFGRVKITCTNCSATEDTLVTAYLVGNK